METFKIRLDTSGCAALADKDERLGDEWFFRDLTFESGKIYGLVSERGQGCEYLSCFLGGKLASRGVKVFYDEKEITREKLCEIGFDLEPLNESYGKKTVRKAIDQALKESGISEDFGSISRKFLLTEERADRKFTELSGERWRAAAAYGFAEGKKIFFAPYMTGIFYYQACPGLLSALGELKKNGALIVLPTGSDYVIKRFADEVIYLDPQFEKDELEKRFGIGRLR